MLNFKVLLAALAIRSPLDLVVREPSKDAGRIALGAARGTPKLLI